MGSASILYRPLRLPRFSLRGLLLFFPLAALLAASAANELAEYRREQIAWLELEQLGGRRSGFDHSRRRWGARLLKPLLPEMDWTSGVRLGFYASRTVPPEKLDRALELLPNLPRLRELSLHGLPVTDRHLELLARLPGLIHVDLQETQITDAGLATLDRLPALRYATLAGTAVSDAAIERLSDPDKARYWMELRVSLEAGKSLEIAPALTPPDYLAARSPLVFPAPTPAESLSMYAPINDQTFRRLLRWRQIDQAKRIELAGSHELLAELGRFESWPHVESCDLSGIEPSVKPFDLGFASRWTKLQQLTLPESPLGAKELRSLADCKELSTLICPSAEFDDEAAEVVVRNHPKLSYLRLGPCRLTDRGLAMIAKLPDLYGVRLQTTQVTDEGLDVLRAHAALELLELDWSQYPPQTKIDFGQIAAP